MRPSRKTATRPATSIASSRSCVTNSVVTWISSCNCRSQRRNSLRTLASSAPNGSSSSNTFGSTASARARATRWRWPPESCDGKRLPCASSWISFSSSSTRARISGSFGPLRTRQHAQAERDVLKHVQVPEQRVMLEGKTGLALAGGNVRHVLAVKQNLRVGRVGKFQTGDDAQQRRLAGTGRPQQRDEFAGLDLQAHVCRARGSCRISW